MFYQKLANSTPVIYRYFIINQYYIFFRINYVFCDDPLLVSYLRPGVIDGWAILALLVKQLRQAGIFFRGDSEFCRHCIPRWCKRHSIGYIAGLTGNSRLQRLIEDDFVQVEKRFKATGERAKLPRLALWHHANPTPKCNTLSKIKRPAKPFHECLTYYLNPRVRFCCSQQI